MTLYGSPHSRTMRVLWMLTEVDQAFDLVPWAWNDSRGSATRPGEPGSLADEWPDGRSPGDSPCDDARFGGPHELLAQHGLHPLQ